MFRLLQSTAFLQMAKSAGMDLVIFDQEHGTYGREVLGELLNFTRAINLGAFVRVPEISRGCISSALDCGADGVIVPMLESAEQARELVNLAKYPPLGRRGFSSMGGHSRFQKVADCREFFARSNDATLCIAQIETANGIREVETIACTPGLDGLFVGPNDLAVSLGCPGDFENPRLDEAILKVAKTCAATGKIFGLHAPQTLLAKWLPQQLSLVVSSLDLEIVARGLSEVSNASRELFARGEPPDNP